MSEEVGGTRSASGNHEGEEIVLGESLRLRSEVLGQERPLLIHLPEDYETSPETFPVLYLLDGSDHFHHVTGIAEHLAWAQRIPRVIVVGIPNIDRVPDLSPPSSDPAFQVVMPFVGETFERPIPETGGADRFRRFLAEEVAPFVEARYRTASFRILVGYSLGGLFGIHSLLEQPEVFDATLAISPPLWWNDGSIPSRASEVLTERSASTPRFLYMTVGGRERASIMIEPLQEFVAALEGIEPEWLRWWYHVMPDETQQAVIHRAVYDGLETIFDDYALPEVLRFTADVSRLRSHYAAASATYG